jgi:hypothetical protein
MRIVEITSQSRRDFRALFQCEHCEKYETLNGYDDEYFHRKVVPEMICKNCGNKADKNYRPLTTKYPDGMQI